MADGMIETLLKCGKFDICRKTTVDRDGQARAKDIVVHPGAVVVLAMPSPDECLMLRHHRTAIDRVLWELPAGTLDVPGETPEAAAIRELEEETGYRAKSMDYLCEFFPSPGFLTELIRVYVARDLTATKQALEPSERIEVEIMPIARAIELIGKGEIVDGKTIITLLVHRLRTEGGR